MARAKERFFRDRSLYEQALRRRVCSRCVDFGADGVCHSLDSEGCAVLRYLPELVAISQKLNELKIEPYVAAVRKNICMKCRGKKEGGECELRDTVDCGLDRYLPLILEAIEEVNALKKNAKGRLR